MPAPLPAHAAVGNVLAGKYKLLSVIGRGGMGVVMAAEHLTLGKRVAVKLLLSEADANTRARFQLEARAAALIASPHVAQVLDFGFTADGLAFIVMEYLEGHDLLAERKRRGKLPPAEAIDLVLEAAAGLAQAHAVGLVHRDIKPANIFLATTPGGRIVKILDFGLIKVMDDGASLTNSTDTFGTPKYMAPEQLRAAKDVTERSDQHALGCVLFELIAGRAAFEGDSIPDIIVRVCTEPAPSLTRMGVDVPLGVDRAIQRALAKSQGERFPTLAEFASELAPFGTPRATEYAREISASLTVERSRSRSGAFADLRRTELQPPRASYREATPVSVSTLVPADPTTQPSAASLPSVASLAFPPSLRGISQPTAPLPVDAFAATAEVPASELASAGESMTANSGTLSASSLSAARRALPPRESEKKTLTIAVLAGVACAGIAAALFVHYQSGKADPAARPSASVVSATNTSPDARTATAVPSLPASVSALPSEAPVASSPIAPSPSATTSAHVAPNLSLPERPRPTARPTVQPPPTAPTQCSGLQCL